MNDSIPDLERRKVELDRMMENLRNTICTETFELESLKHEKLALMEKIDRLKREQKSQL